MGRRRAKAMAAPKKRPTLAKRFKCPFCANEDVVECKMDHRAGIGSLACRMCGVTYQMPIHHLHEPIDVFSEWLDDCEAAEKANGIAANDSTSGRYAGTGVDDDDDDDIMAPSGLNAGDKKRAANIDSDDANVGDEDSDED